MDRGPATPATARNCRAAPPLLGPKWRNGDGSFEMILHVVRGGVPGTVMVAHPGGISEAQTLQVATYIFAASHGLTKP